MSKKIITMSTSENASFNPPAIDGSLALDTLDTSSVPDEVEQTEVKSTEKERKATAKQIAKEAAIIAARKTSVKEMLSTVGGRVYSYKWADDAGIECEQSGMLSVTDVFTDSARKTWNERCAKLRKLVTAYHKERLEEVKTENGAISTCETTVKALFEMVGLSWLPRYSNDVSDIMEAAYNLDREANNVNGAVSAKVQDVAARKLQGRAQLTKAGKWFVNEKTGERAEKK